MPDPVSRRGAQLELQVAELRISEARQRRSIDHTQSALRSVQEQISNLTQVQHQMATFLARLPDNIRTTVRQAAESAIRAVARGGDRGAGNGNI